MFHADTSRGLRMRGCLFLVGDGHFQVHPSPPGEVGGAGRGELLGDVGGTVSGPILSPPLPLAFLQDKTVS